MHKKILLLSLICIVSLFSVVYADNYEYLNPKTEYFVVIEDDASLLSSSQIAALANDMKPLTEHGNIVFKSTNVNNKSTREYAHDCYYDRFGSQTGSLFLIDMDHREIWIHSDGDNYTLISTSKANSITDNVFRYASQADYYGCASSAFKQMERVLNGQKIPESMKYICNALISLTIGFFVSFFFVWKNSRIKSASSHEIIKNCKVNFKIGTITATKTGEHKVYSPVQSSSSSGFSSGGHGSGGGGHSSGHSSHSSHSSGGGGGHRF